MFGRLHFEENKQDALLHGSLHKWILLQRKKDRHISRHPERRCWHLLVDLRWRGFFFDGDAKRMGIFIRQFCHQLLQCNFGPILFGVCPNVHTRSLVLLESDQKCSISQENAKNIFVYFLRLFGAVLIHISTIGLVTPSKFGISGVWYGYMVSYFGISYAVSQLFLVPYICKNYGTEKTRLMGSLAVTGAGRLYLGFTKSVYILFILHFFVAVGSALLMHTTTIIVNRFGHQFHLGGTVKGAMDSVRRLSGVIAPMIAVPVHYVYYYKKDGTGMSPKAVLASLFYFCRLWYCIQAFDKVSVKATKNSDGTIQSKKVQ